MSIPLFNAQELLTPLRAQLRERAIAVLDSGRYVLGPQVDAFEREFAQYLGSKHVVGVANGTEALTIALRALGVGEGDEVIVPSFTFYASAEAIPPTGARVVFCDVDRDTFCVTKETVRAAMTAKTKAIIAVDLFGNVAPIEEIKTLGVPVVEDAAQACGSVWRERKAGSLGTVATFSFFPSKNLGGFGDGGAVVTDDDQLAQRIRMLRFHGSRDKSCFELVGYNSRLDELQAGLLRVLLGELDCWTQKRLGVAQYYLKAGLGELVALPCPVLGATPAWHLYVIRHNDCDRIANSLTQAGIGCRAYYRKPVHQQPAMNSYSQTINLPITDELARTHLAIPFGPALTQAQAQSVVETVAGVVGDRGATGPSLRV
jgi:dTDP-4-amino-4,6-dideoxygalactose transaminase